MATLIKFYVPQTFKPRASLTPTGLWGKLILFQASPSLPRPRVHGSPTLEQWLTASPMDRDIIGQLLQTI